VACPTNAIRLGRDPSGARVGEIDYGACIFCGVCLDACPNEAITATEAFELAVRERSAAVVSIRIGAGRE
jgi:NADH-quinone oxidoreductase subunit I